MADWLCYTDGSVKSGDEAPGGWGFVVRSPKGTVQEGFGSEVRTLPKIMEYRAVAEALAVLPNGVSAVVFSDNQSLVENLEKRLEGWAAHDFAKVDSTIAADVRRIHEAIRTHALVVRYQWVRAHNGNVGNERADALAAQGAREAKSRL